MEDHEARCLMLERLDHRSLPHFGQLATVLLLAAATVAAAYPWEVANGVRQQPASILWWLPEALLRSPASVWICRATFALGAGLWIWRKLLPWSCWIAVFSFTCLWSLHVENSSHTNHCVQMTNNLLVVQALWETLLRREIREASAEGRFWETPLYPRWAKLAAVAYIGIFQSAAGLSKLVHSGPAWADGTSLQIWTSMWAYPWSPVAWLILHSPSFAQAVQVATLAIETVGVLALLPVLRAPIGLLTVALYAGIVSTFHFGFHLNLLFAALFLLPFERWIEERVRSSRASSRELLRVAAR